MPGINKVKVINGITRYWRRLFGCKREAVSGGKKSRERLVLTEYILLRMLCLLKTKLKLSIRHF